MCINLKELSTSNNYEEFVNNIKSNKSVTLKSETDVSLINYTENNLSKSFILDKKTMKPIVFEFNKTIYNNDAINFLQDKNWSNVVVNESYENHIVIVYNINDKWFISIKKDYDKKYYKNISYREIFEDCIKDKFKYCELNKDYCYYFSLQHYKNKGLVQKTNYYNDILYKDIIHLFTLKKNSFEEVNEKINYNVIKNNQIYFSNLSELLDDLAEISEENENKKKLSTEGYMIRYYLGEVYNSEFILLKIQTSIYQEIYNLLPKNTKNLHMMYLQLYQKDKLIDYLPYFTKYNTDIIRRINNSMRNIAQELLNLYHGTRHQNNPDIYGNLKENYKKVLYDLHGIFISYRKPKYINGNEKHISNRSITVHDVYHYLKSSNLSHLKNIYIERNELLETDFFDLFLNRDDLDTLTLTTLLFQNTNLINNKINIKLTSNKKILIK